MNIAMILSGGVGARFGAETPKQYQDLLGKPVVEYVVQATLASEKIDRTLVVCAEEYVDWFKNRFDVDVCLGGKERNISFKNGMNFIKEHYNCDKLMVFDAMRPFVTPELIDLYMDKLDEYQVVATCQRIVDSLGCLDFLECDRSRYYILQSPEAFRFDLIYNNFDPNSPLVEAYQQLPEGTTLYKHFDFPDNYKLTYHHDLDFMRMYMSHKKSKEK
ncbi:MAG: 2-C-methyl-D-erythritol 4-phosphate cytidylyltransferase [Clostridia bacterium]|nr:2-C-methyl-D-erythritol 4-phosphate cytidylyltransferase [Clostridia bacterium]